MDIIKTENAVEEKRADEKRKQLIYELMIGMCILLTGNMFKDIYDRQGYERCLLSRTTEDAVTVTSVLVPWNTCGMTQATVLGVATFTYLPYCFFNILSPLMSIFIASIGYKIVRHKPDLSTDNNNTPS